MPEHPLSMLREIDPRFMETLAGSDDQVYGDGALPRKVKLLIALAFDAAHGADQGVRYSPSQVERLCENQSAGMGTDEKTLG